MQVVLSDISSLCTNFCPTCAISCQVIRQCHKNLFQQFFFYVTHAQELTISKEVGDRSSEASTHGNLAVAYQALGSHEMALVHYHSHLNIARELKDVAGEACALCNLGNCHSSKGKKLVK